MYANVNSKRMSKNNYVTAKRTVENIMLKNVESRINLFSRIAKEAKTTNFFVLKMSASLPKKSFDL